MTSSDQGRVIALSLTQPWATLVVTGRKRYETRGWRAEYRGPILIHASAAMPGYAKRAAAEFGLPMADLPLGAIIGRVTVVDMVRTERAAINLGAEEIAMGDYSDHRWAWRLEDAEQWDPIPCKGALGLWRVPPGPLAQAIANRWL